MENTTSTPPLRGITFQALIPMRREPAEQAEMVSQLLFGETYRVEETAGNWMRIITEFDNYEGWIDNKLFEDAPADFTPETTDTAIQFATVAEITFTDGTRLLTPAGSRLPEFNVDRKTIVVKGLRCTMSSPFESLICPPGHDVLQTTRQFLHTPYVWGGRSTFGFDCSGLVQTVYHIHRKNLPRDASQQFLAGDKVPVLQEAEPGDLAFFAGKSGKISHVGILDGLGNILHCSGKVRIDHITEEGIRHADSRDLTHRLAGIKRLPG